MRTPPAKIIQKFLADARSGKQPLGIFSNLNSPTFVEILGAAGHRFVIFDQQHTSTNHETLVSLLRAAELHSMFAMVRIQSTDPIEAIRALDAGAHAIWVQGLADAQAVREFISACLYPPLGERNYCLFPRANGNGLGDSLSWIDYSNKEPVFVIGLNNEEILDELDEVMDIPRADVFALNPADVIVRTGYGEFDDFFQMHNIAKGVNKSIRDAGKLTMMPFFPPDPNNIDEARKFLSEQMADMWFSADFGCFLAGLGKLVTLQKALIEDRDGEMTGANAGNPAAKDSETAADEGSEEADDSKLDFVRTC